MRVGPGMRAGPGTGAGTDRQHSPPSLRGKLWERWRETSGQGTGRNGLRGGERGEESRAWQEALLWWNCCQFGGGGRGGGSFFLIAAPPRTASRGESADPPQTLGLSSGTEATCSWLCFASTSTLHPDSPPGDSDMSLGLWQSCVRAPSGVWRSPVQLRSLLAGNNEVF